MIKRGRCPTSLGNEAAKFSRLIGVLSYRRVVLVSFQQDDRAVPDELRLTAGVVFPKATAIAVVSHCRARPCRRLQAGLAVINVPRRCGPVTRRGNLQSLVSVAIECERRAPCPVLLINSLIHVVVS